MSIQIRSASKIIRERRPRVAAIGLTGSQLDAITPLVGTLRAEDSFGDYVSKYSWTETDIVVAGSVDKLVLYGSVHLLAVGAKATTWYIGLSGGLLGGWQGSVTQSEYNTEREIKVADSCPDLYKPLVADLALHVSRLISPPSVFSTQSFESAEISAIGCTTSGHPAALRMLQPKWPTSEGSLRRPSVSVFLTHTPDLASWFDAFLQDVHRIDPGSVPDSPRRRNVATYLHTPAEKRIAQDIAELSNRIAILNLELDGLHQELAAQSAADDSGVRRAIWSDGEDLVGAVAMLLNGIGFEATLVDSDLAPGEPKCEDLRIKSQSMPDWEAIGEIKGYKRGTKTSDARQIREYRDRYARENSAIPDLTLWIANPYRELDPELRPSVDRSVDDAACLIGAIYVSTIDLYRLWVRVASEEVDSATAVQSLVNAQPGIWTLPD